LAGDKLPAGAGLPPGFHVRVITPLPPVAGTTERKITVDQTSESVIVGERLVVKWFAEPAWSAFGRGGAGVP
jgi:hypothetical protein